MVSPVLQCKRSLAIFVQGKAIECFNCGGDHFVLALDIGRDGNKHCGVTQSCSFHEKMITNHFGLPFFLTKPTLLQKAICHKARDCPEGGKSKGKGGKSKGSPGMLWIVAEIVCILFERTNAWMKMLITVASG